MTRMFLVAAAVAAFAVACSSPAAKPWTPEGPTPPPAPTGPSLLDPREVHLANLRQLTFGGENAEAYWSYDGTQLIFQSTQRPKWNCDQMMTVAATGGEPKMVSTGKGRTTCGYFMPGDQEIIYSSTHEHGDACPPEPDHTKGYVWALFDFDLYRAKPDGSNPIKFASQEGSYDAEATVCAKDGSIVFTSDRDGDLELYRMDKDGNNVVRLTNAPGYDGGAFFSPDCSKIVWRASRPTGDDLADYQKLLAEKLVRPSKLEIFVANANGSDARQITYFGVASFAPFFHPSGKRILFASNYPDPKGREFDIWAVNVDGTDLEQITFAAGFDGFPMFSPDGKQLAFGSNRRAPGATGGKRDTNVFVADWIDKPAGADRTATIVPSAADRFASEVAWLADDQREGRGVGTKGLDAAAGYIETAFKAAGVEPGNGDSYRQAFDLTIALEVGDRTKLAINGKAVEGAAKERMAGAPIPTEQAWTPLPLSKTGTFRGKVMRAGWGLVDKGKKLDDYKGKSLKGKFAVVHRFAPATGLDEDDKRRLGDLEYKAFAARQKGAAGLIVVDDGDPAADEAPLPALDPRSGGDAGIPVIAVRREVAAALVDGAEVEMTIEIEPVRTKAENVIGKIVAGASSVLPGTVVIGAHYDHLGQGGASSLDGHPGIHNGADDNASGVAALLEVGRRLAEKRAELPRNVYLVAFSGEELGLLGSTHLVKNPPWQGPVTAMLNMDMVGRLRLNTLNVLGSESATEWKEIVLPICHQARITCTLSGNGYGPSDHMAFYVAGAPVLHFFTGGHLDYHRSSDDSPEINAVGGAQVAGLVADLGVAVAKQPKLSYAKVAAPPQGGDLRARGASLGTIPAYVDDPGQPAGVALSDVVPDGPAAKAGLAGGDRIVQVGPTEIRNIQDLMFVLSAAKPGQSTTVTYLRGGKRYEAKVTYGPPRRRNK